MVIDGNRKRAAAISAPTSAAVLPNGAMSHHADFGAEGRRKAAVANCLSPDGALSAGQ